MVVNVVKFQLEKILQMLKTETHDDLWTTEQRSMVEEEISELYTHFQKGEVYFKYGKKQRMLQSTYLLTDDMNGLSKTPLGEELLHLQTLYQKL